jgi:hypothetical protein
MNKYKSVNTINGFRTHNNSGSSTYLNEHFNAGFEYETKVNNEEMAVLFYEGVIKEMLFELNESERKKMEITLENINKLETLLAEYRQNREITQKESTVIKKYVVAHYIAEKVNATISGIIENEKVMFGFHSTNISRRVA